ncbi:hypothetical protein GCM10012275_32340 [Longimycelium tulufanense]|uniref:Uncharacterized protein n=1 Tax=Longimycelium tulufanense TaxID=907463 RepID=A0A8J3CGS0_9PSEU|nr:hypothetical protein [Longimycelium tulufanense]GGM58693.1 hypothetical protein GCM10012275_32340 [Longimycelium tulufanense]
MFGPDLPEPHEPIDIDVYWHRWPTAIEQTELVNGTIVFTGLFDERDVAIAARAYPGRRVHLGEDGRIEVHPARPEDLLAG